MEPLHFKILLTVLFGIGAVAGFLGQLINIYAFHKGLPVKPKLITGWILNPILIYGVWNWL